MCQMCDEYENELVRMGLIDDAKTFREERHREDGKTGTVDRAANETEKSAERREP